MKEQLMNLSFQKPNTYLFGFFPYKLWIYNWNDHSHDTVTDAFNTKTSPFTQKPVVFDSTLTQRSINNMKIYLFNLGYFDAQVTSEVKTNSKKKKTSITYTVNTDKGFKVHETQYLISDTTFDKDLRKEIEKNSLLANGVIYSNTLAANERSRIVKLAKDHGYYAFPAENISFELDTFNTKTVTNKSPVIQTILNGFWAKTKTESHTLKIKVFIQTKDSTKFGNAFSKYYYKNIYVLPDYTEDMSLREERNKTPINFDNLEYHFHNKQYIHPKILSKKIFLRPGQLYQQSRYDQTNSQLNDLGIFQYTRIYVAYDRQDSTQNLLNAYVLLYPNKQFDFNTNYEVSGGDVYIIGNTVNASVTNKNLFKGANKFTIGATYGIEFNQNKSQSGSIFNKLYLQTQNFGINTSLVFPKFLLPFNTDHFSQNMMPQTIMTAGINYMSRKSYFALTNINYSFAYNWRETSTKSWKVTPVFINRLHLSNIDSIFQERMDTVQAIKNAYQETFIEGEGVEFTFNKGNSRGTKYLKLGIEEGGGLVSGVNEVVKAFGSKLGISYAHYVRLDFDARQYLTSNLTSWAFRFYGGVGIPYGGSTVLPYIKQYFVGGPYSIRGWGPRLLGPGSYYNAAIDDPSKRLFIDQSGDIKLELNGEYRFNMFKLFSGAVNLNGALFADAGNIWLAHNDPSLPGAEWAFNKLYQDVAMSTGAGIRADLGGFLVLRLDLAFPVKKPYVSENGGWVIDKIDFGSGTWRSNNLNLNVAIGYPF